MYEERLRKVIQEELTSLVSKEVESYSTIELLKYKLAIGLAIVDSTKEQINIVITNYKEALEQILLSDRVSSLIYDTVISEIDSHFAKISFNTDEPIKDLLTVYSLENNNSLASCLTDTIILNTLGDAMHECQSLLSIQFVEVHEVIMQRETNHEENMVSLAKLTNLAITE